jgi:hypothetical protein
MKSWALIAAAAWALCATAALPQTSGHTSARAEGDALLSAARATDLFDNLTAPGAGDIKLRHKASGLICAFNPGDPSNSVVVFDAAVRGDEIACTTAGEAGTRALYATRAPGRTLDQAFAHDVETVRRSHPGAQAYDLPADARDGGVLALLDAPPLPASRTARFIADHQFTSVSSAIVDGWAIEFRYSCPEERQDVAAAVVQPTLWVTALAQVSKAPINLTDPKQAV